MDIFFSDLVRPLSTAENNFLQILVSKFLLNRRESGSELQITFNKSTPAIWVRAAKSVVKEMMPDFDKKSRIYQAQLDEFLLDNKGDAYKFDDKDFPFRYTSGGTLPLIRMGSKEYYCFFYRDIFPIGWNIANGGSDNLSELLYPIDTIERELREELFIIDIKNRKRYVFAGDLGKPLNHPVFNVIRRFWKERFSWLDLSDFEEVPNILKFLNGPDCLNVHMEGSDDNRITEGCFLNLNAEDFGIEIDKVAKIHLDENAILLDGEIIDNQLVNSVIGLFEVDKLNNAVNDKKTAFYPDIVYYDTSRYEIGNKNNNSKLTSLIQESFSKVSKVLTENEKANFQQCVNKFDLCPVTKRIVQRYQSATSKKETTDNGPFDVFISYGGEDNISARKVFDYFRGKSFKPFFSDETIRDPHFSRVIDDALDTTPFLVVVGTELKNLQRPWVEYEYRAFHHDMLSRPGSNKKIISFISKIDPVYIPLPLREYQAVVYSPSNIDDGLTQLAKYIVK